MCISQCEITSILVILDADLAALYGVSTKRLNEQVRRNRERFPEDFMFHLTAQESGTLRSQIATSRSHGGRRYLPYAFTEHGTIMAANVLSSERAVRASVQVVRAFVKLRSMLASNAELSRKLAELEGKYDRQFMRSSPRICVSAGGNCEVSIRRAIVEQLLVVLR